MTGFPGTTTYGSLTDEIIGGLQAYTMAPDTLTILTESMSATDTRIKVEDVVGLAKGTVEVGNELIYLKGVDEAASELQTNLAWRGYRGTLAEAHANGTTVTFNPTFARSVVRREINNVLLSVYPTVYGIGTVEFTTASTKPSIELPADAVRILAVRYSWTSTDGWSDVKAWNLTHAAPSEYSTRVVLDLYGLLSSGVTLQVVYATTPRPLVNDDDLFTSTGLEESAKDIVVFGVQWRLAQLLDLARLPVVDAQSDEMDANKQTGSAIQVANTFYKLHTAAVERVRSALNLKYPTRSHKVR